MLRYGVTSLPAPRRSEIVCNVPVVIMGACTQIRVPLAMAPRHAAIAVTSSSTRGCPLDTTAPRRPARLQSCRNRTRAANILQRLVWYASIFRPNLGLSYLHSRTSLIAFAIAFAIHQHFDKRMGCRTGISHRKVPF